MNTTINNVQNKNINNNTSDVLTFCRKCHKNKPLSEYNKDKSKQMVYVTTVNHAN